MGYFRRSNDDDQGDSSRHPGEPPSAADQRLHELTGGELFTSTLGVEEFALLKMLGPAPIAQVMGASVHQVGWQYLPPSAQWGDDVFCPLFSVTQAWDDARQNAFDRLSKEAAAVDADAVVGVTLTRGEHDWARKSVDYVVSGTAIRDPELRDPSGKPVLSDLSVQDYWKLAAAGWAPAGVVATTSVFFIAQSFNTAWRRRINVASNQELTEYSRGVSAARKDAINMIAGQSRRVGASGIVGVEFDHRIEREKLDVAKVYGYQLGQGGYRSSTSPTTVALGGHTPVNQGSDSRSGIVVTIQAVGTAIRRRQRVTSPVTQTIMSLGSAA